MEAMKKTDDEFYNEFCEGVNVVKYPDGGIAVSVGFDRGAVGDDDLEKIWETLVPEMFAEFECFLDPEDCTMTLCSAAPLNSFIVRKASVALYLMAKHGIPAREALVIMRDGMLFDLFKYKKPYGISQEEFDERCDLFLKDSAGVKELGVTLACNFIFYDDTVVVFSISILGIQTRTDLTSILSLITLSHLCFFLFSNMHIFNPKELRSICSLFWPRVYVEHGGGLRELVR